MLQPLLLASAAALALGGTVAQAETYRADITRTAYGIPHIVARDFGGLGYGQAYAFAQDNLCLLADRVLTVNGERSKHLGADGVVSIAFTDVPNLESDFYFRAQDNLPELRRGFAATSRDYQALVRGYVAGFNRYLRDVAPAKRPAACRDAGWVRPITVDDMLRINEDRMTQAGAGAWLRQVADARPPSAEANAVPIPPAELARAALEMSEQITPRGLGSNGWAFGRDATRNRRGLLHGNPHFPWETTNRFYEVHLTIPGRFDAMGASTASSAGVSMGFNRDVAWTHTVSTDRHFTLFELALAPDDPTIYVIDGRRVPMARREVVVEIRGRVAPERRTYFSTQFGPVVANPRIGLAWTPRRAFALKDANRANGRAGDTWLNIARARSVEDIRKAVSRSLGVPWVNTIAADRHGQALFADVTAAPNVSAEKLKACAGSPDLAPLAAGRLYVLSGARAACDWDVAPDAPVAGLMSPRDLPVLTRTDYVANSNESYWLANPAAPMAARSPLVGLIDTPQNLRTRAGILEIGRRLAGSDGLPGVGFDPDAVKAIIYRNRNLAAEMVLDDLLPACRERPAWEIRGKTVDVAQACGVLAGWDRRMDVDSVGAHLFVEFWKRADPIKDLWREPFDAKDPLNTPRGLNIAGAGDRILEALAEAVADLDDLGVPLGARYGDVHVAVRGTERIPVHGGDDLGGVLNTQRSKYVPGIGFVPFHGTSFHQVVTFDEAGPVAEAVLTYSQSTDPASPFFADQTRLHAQKGWVRLPFHRADVAANAISHMRISESGR